MLCVSSCKAVFVDTDLLPAAESRVGDLVQNAVEAELVRQFTETLVRCGRAGVADRHRHAVPPAGEAAAGPPARAPGRRGAHRGQEPGPRQGLHRHLARALERRWTCAFILVPSLLRFVIQRC